VLIEVNPLFKGEEFIEGSGFFQMKRILLVDDHEMARQTLRLFLEQDGYACKEAEHGPAALAWLEQGQHVDLIVSDNQMPVMTGMEFLVQVKATPHFRTIPFILFSGNITDEIQRQAHQAGAMAVLNKPYNFSDFVAIVTKALETP
jgi:CheY-like chemotaxis protein